MNFGSSSPTRAPCVILGHLIPYHSPEAPPATPRHAHSTPPSAPGSRPRRVALFLLFSPQLSPTGDYVHLQPPIGARRASLLRHRRAIRALAMVWWAPRDAVRPTRTPRRAFSADSTTSPNSPATPRWCSFGCSPPTRRPCVVLVGPVHCPSRRRPPPATRLARGQGLTCRAA